MNTSAIILMTTVLVSVTAINAYFFYKVMAAPTDEGEHTDMPDVFEETENP